MSYVCDRWAGKPCEEEGHVSPEAGETREGGQGRSGELRRYELAEQGAVGGSEEQDRHHSEQVKGMSAKWKNKIVTTRSDLSENFTQASPNLWQQTFSAVRLIDLIFHPSQNTTHSLC